MSSFFCCMGKSSVEEGDDDSKPKGTVPPPIQPSSKNIGAGCCCYRCLVTGCQSRDQGRSRYTFLKKEPEVRDAAVDTEIDFGIVLHDFVKADHSQYGDCFGEAENADENDLRDHKYVSLQFDSKPGKLKYVEGSQVFYVEVRDKKTGQFRKNSCDKSISEEEEFGMDSDLSADILCDNRSESQRRLLSELEAKSRRKHGDNSNFGIVYVTNKGSPANSIDSLDKKLNRSFLDNIEEDQEQYGEYNLHAVKHPNTTSKDSYNIDGGHFARSLVTPDEVEIEFVDSNKKSECSSASVSMQSCSQIVQNEPEAETREGKYEESEFADVSSQSIPDTRQPSDFELYTPTQTASSDSNDERSIPREYFQKSFYTLDWPLPKKLTDDPSTLLITDHPCSLTSIPNKEKRAQESSSCPDMSFRSESVYSTSLSTIASRDNSLTAETTNIEPGLSASVETQTDPFDADNASVSSVTTEKPQHSVGTETECDSREDDTLEESSKKDTDQVSSSKINSGTESNNSENDQSTSNLENLSTTDSDCESSLGESDSSLNSDEAPKKKTPSNTSDSSSSSGSSSSKSVRKLNQVPHRDKESENARKKKHGSSSSLEGSSSNSSSSCALSSSSSICSTSSASNRSDSANEGSSVDLRNGNG